MVLKVILGALLVLLIGAVVFGLVALALWWLVPIAFPLLPFTYPQALALTGIACIIGAPAMRS